MPEVTYALSFAEMSSAIDAAKTRAAQIEALLEEMDAQTRSNLASWTGDAQQAYNSAYAICKNAADLMPTTLDQARATLSSITEGYDTTERAVSGSFS